MTEVSWLRGPDPLGMLYHVRPLASERQLWHLGAACGRLVWDLLSDSRLKAAVVCAEAFAAGTVGERKLATHQRLVRRTVRHLDLRVRAGMLADEMAARPPAEQDMEACYAARREADAADTVLWAVRPPEQVEVQGHTSILAFERAYSALTWRYDDDTRWRTTAVLADIFRCIFGNPFRPFVFDPSHRTEAAVALARGMYDSRDFSAAPVLADALEDAGLSDAAVLGHLRQAAGHVRGCWVVDGVLGLG